MNNYEVLSVIGEGAYGVVLRCRNRLNREEVAIKRFKSSNQDLLLKKTIQREIFVLKSMYHKNIVELKQVFCEKGIVSLVFQLLDNNLLEILQKQESGLPIQQLKKIISQLLEGLKYMHDRNYIHRDIKPENLLIGAEQCLKICDMGFARSQHNHGQPLTDYVATRWYRAPELLVGAPYAEPIDLWATGCIMAELIDGNPLFPGTDQLNQLYLLKKHLGKLPDSLKAYEIKNNIKCKLCVQKQRNTEYLRKIYHGKLSKEGIDLMSKMLHMDQYERITVSEALKHPFLSGNKCHILQIISNQILESWKSNRIKQKRNFKDAQSHQLLQKVRKKFTINCSSFGNQKILSERQPFKGSAIQFLLKNQKNEKKIRDKPKNNGIKLFLLNNNNKENQSSRDGKKLLKKAENSIIKIINNGSDEIKLSSKS